MSKLLLFAMLDDTTLPLLSDFVTTHLNNGVFPRLLGFAMDDGLTTPVPSMDKKGRFTILRELGMQKSDFMALLQLLRTQDIWPEALEGARRAALLVGGVSAVDTYVCKPPALPLPNPMEPGEDHEQAYQWAVMVDSAIKDSPLLADGWTVAGKAEIYRYYMRRRYD